MNTNKTLFLPSTSISSFFSVFICVHLWLISTASAASPKLPQGLADPAGRIGFFASAASGIDCLDLASGKLLWQTHEAQLPLLLDGDHLIAQAGTKRNRLRILRLDLKRNGECDFESDPIVFPSWVVTGDAHGHSFAASWHLVKHQLVLDWDARAWYIGKDRPTPEQEQAARKHASGSARIDLGTGQIEILPAPTARSSNLADETREESLHPLPKYLEKKSLRWLGQVGSHGKGIVLEEENGQQRFVFHSWDRQNEKPQPPKELLHGKRLLVRTTLDEQILCVRAALPQPDENSSFMPKKTPNWWRLFSVQSGESLGRIPDDAGMHAIAVLGRRVFYLVPGALHGALNQPNVQPQILRAVDLSSGKKLWEHPIAGKLIAPPPPPL